MLETMGKLCISDTVWEKVNVAAQYIFLTKKVAVAILLYCRPNAPKTEPPSAFLGGGGVQQSIHKNNDYMLNIHINLTGANFGRRIWLHV